MYEDLLATEAGGGPLPERIYRAVGNAVRSGRLKPGVSLPSSRRLAADLRISRNSVNAAYELLRADGIIAVRQGAAPVVVTDARFDAARVPGGVAAPRLSKRGLTLSVNVRGGKGWGLFEPGAPDEDLFPADLWARTLRRVARRRYGEAAIYAGIEGLPQLREALAAYLNRARGVKAEPRQVIIVPSTQSALTIAAQCLADPGEAALVESPGYFGARTAFAAAGLETGALEVDGEGATLTSLAGRSARLIYVTPSHQFPTGARMTLQRRLDLLDYARRSGAVIIEDDYDSEFLWEGRAIAALQGISEGHEVIYIGTTAKSLLPGLRLAYMVVPEPLADAFIQTQRNLGMRVNIHAQAALAELIETAGLATHLRRIANVYQERGRLLIEGLRRRFGDRLEVVMPMGGLQTVLRFPGDIDDGAVSAKLAAEGFETPSLSSYCVGIAQRGLVVGFADASEKRVARFADALDAALKII